MSRREPIVSREAERLNEARRGVPWRKWGPYLSERQWGTVREDYSRSGDAWNYFSHDQARSRAYRWGEDGLAGISDDRQLLCFGLALWNGRDPIIKERLFGLTNGEGNHGEDVKEYYFYLDSTPTHSYMKFLYKYPQSEYPYEDLVTTNRRRSRDDYEYELIDTGIFDDDRYFDVFVEYAKATPEDILIEITVANRAAVPASLHVLPTLWFRNIWSSGVKVTRPQLQRVAAAPTVLVSHPHLGDLRFHADGHPTWLFTENETNAERFGLELNASRHVKDGINNHVVHGQPHAVNPDEKGTKAAAHYFLTVDAGASVVIRLRLSDAHRDASRELAGEGAFGAAFQRAIDDRRMEAHEFYETIIPGGVNADAANVMRQALAGMLWSKQFYNYDVDKWLSERGGDAFDAHHNGLRNDRWHHMNNTDIISMPDKWEYPWYAAWDLAFHVLALTLVDEDFGKQQLDLMLQERYLHPNGQLPAYEWNFSDVNPPVHAWATIFTYRLDKARHGQGDIEWLERSFHKLLLNFTWWVNRKDRSGNNVFEGGFLGLDNIGVFDRSAPLPTGGYLEQADGTAWMALYCQNMLEICGELALERPAYVDMGLKFVEHYLWIAASMVHAGDNVGMWDEEDGFFYDVLRLPNGDAKRLKVRSMVGLLPLCAVTVFDGALLAKYPQLVPRLRNFLESRPELTAFIQDPGKRGEGGRFLASVLSETKLRRMLTRMLDEREFLSPFGIRSISRYHARHPYVFPLADQQYRVGYVPAESDSAMFGGNSNWRGPIWVPVNALIIRALLQYYAYYGNSLVVECPTGSGCRMTLYEVAEEISRRLVSIFVRDRNGRRPVYGGTKKFQDDPHWRDLLLFYEYFHGDNGAGLGASHQTGWTGLVARAIHLFSTTTAADWLEQGKRAAGAAPADGVHARVRSPGARA